ncbi:MAG: hypothetical protein O6948_00980 [Deltaproteobacteria bacterium]|nr:hypothetical protein [Deltaproteobacteria bacterium]
MSDMGLPSWITFLLRDVAQNPEWAYVREGPEWWGRRVRSVAALWGKR